MYNAVGIDVSKGKSTVTVLQPGGTVIRKPFDVSHTSQNLNELAAYLDSLDGDTRIVMECTGRYHEPILKALSDSRLVCLRSKSSSDQKLRQQLPAQGQIRPGRRQEDRTLIRLTTGRNCANIQVWITHVLS